MPFSQSRAWNVSEYADRDAQWFQSLHSMASPRPFGPVTAWVSTLLCALVPLRSSHSTAISPLGVAW